MELTINTAELYDILKHTPARQNIMLAGNHGIGKSQILTRYFQDQGMKVVTLFLGQMSDPGDLIGLPRYNEETGCTDFMPPYWFPVDGKPIVLFLDELNRAREEILQTIMDLALNRKLAGHELPEGSRIISAVNAGDEYQVTDLDPALVSRFNIYRFVPSVEEWVAWAEGHGIDSRVTEYIRYNPFRLDAFVPDEADTLKKSPDRRGWEKVSDIIKTIPVLRKAHIKLIAGIVGDEAALDFFDFHNKKKNTVTGSEILEEGKDVFQKLELLSVPEYSCLIDSMFSILNMSSSLNNDEHKKEAYSQNIRDFFNLLIDRNLDEAAAYFIIAISQKKNYNAKLFFNENCKDEVQKIRTFIMDKNLSV